MNTPPSAPPPTGTHMGLSETSAYEGGGAPDGHWALPARSGQTLQAPKTQERLPVHNPRPAALAHPASWRPEARDGVGPRGPTSGRLMAAPVALTQHAQGAGSPALLKAKGVFQNLQPQRSPLACPPGSWSSGEPEGSRCQPFPHPPHSPLPKPGSGAGEGTSRHENFQVPGKSGLARRARVPMLPLPPLQGALRTESRRPGPF